jgi:hypothetical protein
MSGSNGRVGVTREAMRDVMTRAGVTSIEPDEEGGLDAVTSTWNGPVQGVPEGVPTPLSSGTPTNGATEPNLDAILGVPKPLAPYGTRGFGTLHRCDIGEMLATEPEPIDWLATGVAARGYLTLLVGREKTGKSLMALAISARCAEGGGTVAGIECAPARVLYVDSENGAREIPPARARARALHRDRARHLRGRRVQPGIRPRRARPGAHRRPARPALARLMAVDVERRREQRPRGQPGP